MLKRLGNQVRMWDLRRQRVTFLEMVQEYFDEAASFTNISADKLNVYKQCNAVLQVRVPVQRDDGSLVFITGYRA